MIFRTTIVAGLLCGYLWCVSVHAEITPTVTFDSTFDDWADYHGVLTSHFEAAVRAWGAFFDSDVDLEIAIRMDPDTARAGGRSYTTAFLENNGTYNIWEQSAVHEIRTGNDPNGMDPDVDIVFEPRYLTEELWFDPDPFSRTAPVPAGRTDAMSVAIHELGHAFGFIGWRDWSTGELPPGATYASPFDVLVEREGDHFFFTGPRAVEYYGGNVPLTDDNLFHLGNRAPFPGSDLIPDMMNGVVFDRGARYEISMLDLSILSDVGVPIRFPNELIGDVTGDGKVDAFDIDWLSAKLREGAVDSDLDLDADGLVTPKDRAFLVEEILGTHFGDVNLDREVEFGDFLVHSSNFTQRGGWADGNFDGDLTVQFGDFLLLSHNFGKRGEDVSLVVVPEPRGFGLLPAVLWAWAAFGRRWKSVSYLRSCRPRKPAKGEWH